MDWKVYYGDGSTFSSDDGEPREAPPHGVQVIVERVGERTMQHSLGDYYGWDGVQWEANNTKQERWGVVLIGTLFDTARFKQMRGEAMAWLDQLC